MRPLVNRARSCHKGVARAALSLAGASIFCSLNLPERDEQPSPDTGGLQLATANFPADRLGILVPPTRQLEHVEKGVGGFAFIGVHEKTGLKKTVRRTESRPAVRRA